jgi:hypothetical protein
MPDLLSSLYYRRHRVLLNVRYVYRSPTLGEHSREAVIDRRCWNFTVQVTSLALIHFRRIRVTRLVVDRI